MVQNNILTISMPIINARSTILRLKKMTLILFSLLFSSVYSEGDPSKCRDQSNESVKFWHHMTCGIWCAGNEGSCLHHNSACLLDLQQPILWVPFSVQWHEYIYMMNSSITLLNQDKHSRWDKICIHYFVPKAYPISFQKRLVLWSILFRSQCVCM